MRFLLVVAAALTLVSAPWAGSRTQLAITVFPHGKAGPSSNWTLRCGPPGGTLPSPGRACRALARHPQALKPVPKDVACTEQWGGPQVALVRGRYAGHRVLALFNRTNGCEIGRWNALRALFPLAD